jgi:hypothetical protein
VVDPYDLERISTCLPTLAPQTADNIIDMLEHLFLPVKKILMTNAKQQSMIRLCSAKLQAYDHLFNNPLPNGKCLIGMDAVVGNIHVNSTERKLQFSSLFLNYLYLFSHPLPTNDVGSIAIYVADDDVRNELVLFIKHFYTAAGQKYEYIHQKCTQTTEMSLQHFILTGPYSQQIITICNYYTSINTFDARALLEFINITVINVTNQCQYVRIGIMRLIMAAAGKDIGQLNNDNCPKGPEDADEIILALTQEIIDRTNATNPESINAIMESSYRLFQESHLRTILPPRLAHMQCAYVGLKYNIHCQIYIGYCQHEYVRILKHDYENYMDEFNALTKNGAPIADFNAMFIGIMLKMSAILECFQAKIPVHA